ncbi:MAG TPA: hypothetical protein PKD90_05125 [Phnomibacter sp.]|nr:hypothetical protein [Phnomibacter sp.]
MALSALIPYDTGIHTIHVLVALADNTYQGIVPVPTRIGNGQNPNENLYWGCNFGLRSYFKKSKDWHLVKSIKGDSLMLERLIFKHAVKTCYLIADAYNGKQIKTCTHHFLQASTGQLKDTVMADGHILGTLGNAPLVAYMGHNGLMDFALANTYHNADGIRRKAIILACFSQRYFAKLLQNAYVQPLLLTTGLMAPEAYTLHEALDSYLHQQEEAPLRKRAAQAYALYQHCSLRAANPLFVSHW